MLSLNFQPFPVLSTERLLLREATLKDAAILSAIRSDERVNRYLERNQKMSHTEAETRILNLAGCTKKNESIEWILQLKEKPEMIGSICYWNIVPGEDKAEIGYEMHPDYYGKGLMHEAMQEVIRYGVTEMKLKTIEALPHKQNIKSVNLLERNHFIRDFNLEKYNLSETEQQNNAMYILKL